MEFESTQSKTIAKLPILKLGEYEMQIWSFKFMTCTNNFKIVEQEVKKSADAKNGFSKIGLYGLLKALSSTNNVNTANTDVSTVSTNVNTASPKDDIATLSDSTVYAFLSNQPKGVLQ
ncbi:hypothetical protein Tco_0953243 [Tanacetum coccineum]|uniref:Uncharacterized protein n=1 Tax=Tanacetum coccineum TaxID=301880 RepID=A0ABQ5DZN4_9ASTR